MYKIQADSWRRTSLKMTTNKVQSFVLQDVAAHRVFLPAVSQAGPQFLVDDDLLYVLQRRMLTHLLLERQHVLVHRTCEHTPNLNGNPGVA